MAREYSQSGRESNGGKSGNQERLSARVLPAWPAGLQQALPLLFKSPTGEFHRHYRPGLATLTRNKVLESSQP
jgi:hypothetical protein